MREARGEGYERGGDRVEGIWERRGVKGYERWDMGEGTGARGYG